jgi:hypothetical protein
MTGPTDKLPPADDALWALVEGVVADTATPADRARLEERLRADPQARLFYVAYLDLHAQLQWQTRGQSARPGPAARAARPSRRAVLLAVAGGVAAVAAAVLAALVIPRHPTEPDEAPDLSPVPAGAVAVLIDNSKSVWEAGTAQPTKTGSPLAPGRLKLKSGVAEVAFLGGGEVMLEGPAEFDVQSADDGFLHRGKLTARVADGAATLRIGVPGVVVSDAGGEYGLLRDAAGRTEVHVFAGKVGADPADNFPADLPATRPGRATTFAGNGGARLDAATGTFVPIPLNTAAFARLRPEVWAADASVRGGQYADLNYGTAPLLMVKKSVEDYSWETFLRFDLAGVKGPVGAATVRLVPVRLGQPMVNAAAVVDDPQWGETTVTWDTKPGSGPAFATWTVYPGTPVAFDVTRQVQDALAGDKKLCLRVFAPNYKRGRAWVQYGSREGDPAARPQLLITPPRDRDLARPGGRRDPWAGLALRYDARPPARPARPG